jgi:hypothetical protein
MCTDEQHEQILQELKKIVECLSRHERDYRDVPISDAQSVKIDYKGRKYLYVWSPIDIVLNSGDLGNVAIPANTWYPLGFRENHELTSTGQGTTAVILTFCATDELLSALSNTSPVSTNATLSNVNSQASDTLILAANPNRKRAYFYNDSTSILYLSFGTGAASTTSYTVQIPAQGFYELPNGPVFAGQIRGIWSGGNGAVRVTELT